jgi:beta-catenin-like protein 1
MLPPTLPLTGIDSLDEVYQRSKRNGHGNVQDGPSRGQAATVTDEAQEDDDMEGPEMPPDLEEGDEAGEDEDGRFFGGGVNRDTARAIALLDEVDGEEEIVRLFVSLSTAS